MFPFYVYLQITDWETIAFGLTHNQKVLTQQATKLLGTRQNWIIYFVCLFHCLTCLLRRKLLYTILSQTIWSSWKLLKTFIILFGLLSSKLSSWIVRLYSSFYPVQSSHLERGKWKFIQDCVIVVCTYWEFVFGCAFHIMLGLLVEWPLVLLFWVIAYFLWQCLFRTSGICTLFWKLCTAMP